MFSLWFSYVCRDQMKKGSVWKILTSPEEINPRNAPAYVSKRSGVGVTSKPARAASPAASQQHPSIKDYRNRAFG
jgi:hypothetical protein